MNWNLVGSIYRRSFIKIAHFVAIHYQAWPPQAILFSDWLISKKSSPLKPFGQMNRNLFLILVKVHSEVGCIYSLHYLDNAFLLKQWTVVSGFLL
jgi:hypothetical protein